MKLTAEQSTLCDAAIELISEGYLPIEIAPMLGVARRTLLRWLDEEPHLTARYARARDACWDAIAEKLYVMVMDDKVDSKMRRVKLDGGLKLLARWCPSRYGEALLLKHQSVGEEEGMTTDEIVAELIALAKNPIPLALPNSEVVDGEFTNVD